jgi:peptidoglycan/LPS O-acetylase OafA/YrhL
MLQKTKLPARLYSLDALRGLAALTIVFWHWQHFFCIGSTISSTFRPTEQPLFSVFFLFYRNGDRAVDLFFCLSGFIFFWLYSQAISRGEISAIDFFVRRFIRLYPLHLLTLLFVLIEQYAYWQMKHIYFVYQNNDLFHFVLNLFFVSSVGIEKGPSFNQPTWSVSVEFFLYIVFFATCKLNRINTKTIFILSLIGFILSAFYSPLGRGIGSFFLGGCVYRAYLYTLMTKKKDIIEKIIFVLTLAFWIATVFCSFNNVSLGTLFPAMILFPMTILSLVFVETQQISFGKSLSVLGDISYSSYLWHFPLQLIFFATSIFFGGNADSFNSPAILLGFFLLLLLISFVSYHYVEMPVQRYLKSWWFTRRSSLS